MMTITEKSSIGYLKTLPFATQRLESARTLVTGYFGGWTILDDSSLLRLKDGSYLEDAELSLRLADSGIIITDSNQEIIARKYASLNSNLFQKPSLHIVNLTNICNYRCRYCHAGVSRGNRRMDAATARKVATFIMENGEDRINIEFQGGDAMLNFEALCALAEEARRLNNERYGKQLNICVVSNLSLMDRDKMDYLIDNDIQICTSLDGPAFVHDENRVTGGGGKTFQTTIDKMAEIRARMKSKGKSSAVGALCTVTRRSLGHSREIVDLYCENDLTAIHLRPLNSMGDAIGSWDELSYTSEEFNKFWSEALDHIIELNKQGKKIVERGAYFILCKILAGRDPQYTEMMSPCGAGRGQILYNPDGSIYTCDEGRMIREDLFKIGEVKSEEDAIGSDGAINTWASSILELTCYSCAYKPWCGTCPVANYQSRRTIVPNITTNFMHKAYHHQFTYIFNKIDSDPQTVEIFKKWIDDGMW